ncbi:hypothetical protein Hanom_Chr14g01301961 [Helianthus anomalus]
MNSVIRMLNCNVEQMMSCSWQYQLPRYLGAVCFFGGKTSAVCGPHLLTSAVEEVNQTSTICKKKTVCFLT